mmetsp:Transcript_21225/g.32250  ORF Transcript_21225/g.32250 Transcript_21225/m.32250 type:complete len:115 (+) Transcript_21225:322-666(+)
MRAYCAGNLIGINLKRKPISLPGLSLASIANKLSVTPDNPIHEPAGCTLAKKRLENIPPRIQYNEKGIPFVDNTGKIDFPNVLNPYMFIAKWVKVVWLNADVNSVWYLLFLRLY